MFNIGVTSKAGVKVFQGEEARGKAQNAVKSGGGYGAILHPRTCESLEATYTCIHVLNVVCNVV